MNQETAAKGQLIELRAKGWPYEKIARHTGIDQKKLLAWGIQYKDCIDAEREINRAALEESRRLRASADQSKATANAAARSLLPRGEGQDEGQTSTSLPDQGEGQTAAHGVSPSGGQDASDLLPDGCAQESHFYNLHGEARETSPRKTRSRRLPFSPGEKARMRDKPVPSRSSSIRKSSSLATRLSKRVRKLARSPLVRAAIRYAVFKH